MLREISLKENTKRWFNGADEDLYIHLNIKGDIESVEYCYGKLKNEHALIVKSGKTHAHMRVDDGEQNPGNYKASPIYVADGTYDLFDLLKRIKSSIKHLPNELRINVFNFIEHNFQIDK